MDSLRVPRLVRFLWIALLIFSDGPAAFQNEQRPTPVPAAVPWPFSLETTAGAAVIAGEVRFKITTAGGAVTDVQALGNAPLPLSTFATDSVRQWRFEPGPLTSFETTLRHSVDGFSDCNHDINQTVRARVPALIEVVSKKLLVCDPTVQLTQIDEPITAFTGNLRCDCVEGSPVPGAVLAVRDANAGNAARQTRRSVRSDKKGQFRVGGLPPGRYQVRVSAENYRTQEYSFTVAENAGKDHVDLALSPADDGDLDPETIVVGGMIPSYPRQARLSGTQGVVNLRISMQGDRIIDVDADADSRALGEAAAANVRTWRFRSTDVPVLSVRFDYRLVAGDCGTEPNPLVTMRFPHEVRIEAAGGPCLPNAVFQDRFVGAPAQKH